MNSQDIRERIAALEAERESPARPTGDTREDLDPEDLSWESLFGVFGASASEDDFSLNDWLAEGLHGLRSTLRGAGVDDEFWRHLRAAERELLLAVRHLLDVRLEALERANRPADDSSRLQEIDIDFE
ncbi:MAG: hypothetical protein R2844_10460 [Caldilineales bacterium]